MDQVNKEWGIRVEKGGWQDFVLSPGGCGGGT